MSLSRHHKNQLHLIQAGLLRSDPQLAARLSVFGRLSAGQAMPAWEQVSLQARPHPAGGCLDRGDDQRPGRGHLPVPQGGPRPGRRTSRKAAAPGRPGNGANGHGPGRGAGARPDPAAGADRR